VERGIAYDRLANYLLGKNEVEKVETNDVQNIYHFLHILRLK